MASAFLAFAGASIEPDSFVQYTPKTLMSIAALQEQMPTIRAQGFAVDDEEFSPGVRCVPRPVFDKTGRMIAALGVSGPSVRIDDERMAELGNRVGTISITLSEMS